MKKYDIYIIYYSIYIVVYICSMSCYIISRLEMTCGYYLNNYRFIPNRKYFVTRDHAHSDVK